MQKIKDNTKQKTEIEKKVEKEALKKIKPKHGLWYNILDTGVTLVVFLIIVALVRFFLVTPFIVRGSSMVDSFQDGEYIMVDKLSYRLGEIQRGDVVVFTPPIPNTTDYYIKRVIGLPGETVKIKNKQVWVCNEKNPDCFMLDESLYLNEENLGHTCVYGNNCADVEYTVPTNSLFVLGDNRVGSQDSRHFELHGGTFYVPIENIEGRGWIGVWPLNKLGIVPQIGYSN